MPQTVVVVQLVDLLSVELVDAEPVVEASPLRHGLRVQLLVARLGTKPSLLLQQTNDYHNNEEGENDDGSDARNDVHDYDVWLVGGFHGVEEPLPEGRVVPRMAD